MLHLDGDNFISQTEGSREHFVPLHTTDLIEYLALHPVLEPDQRSFREVCSLILALLHHLYRQRHEQLTYAYTPLDPDRDRLLRSVPTTVHRNRLVDELLERTRDALQRANYRKLSPQDIQEAMRAASRWGVRMRVNFGLMANLEVYARGHVIGRRKYRNWRRLFQAEIVDVPLYQRLVVLFRTSEELESSQFDSRRVYMRMFKNVPREDVDMMLPATGIQMTWLDHSKIVVPSLYAAGITLWRFLRNVVLLAFFGVFKTIGLVLLAIFAIGFGIKSMFQYRSNTKRRYMLNMAQSLYFQNLDNNAGVLLRLLDEGEQQEASEAILAYFVAGILKRATPALSLNEISEQCEGILEQMTGMHIDFDIEATARNLIQLGVLNAEEAGWSVLPIDAAIERLDATWDNWFA